MTINDGGQTETPMDKETSSEGTAEVNPLRAKFLRENINIYLHFCHSSTLIRHR